MNMTNEKNSKIFSRKIFFWIITKNDDSLLQKMGVMMEIQKNRNA